MKEGPIASGSALLAVLAVKFPGSRGYRAKLELQARLPGEVSRDDDEAQVLESRCGLLEVEKALDLGDEQGKVLSVGVIEQQKVCPRDGHRVRPSVPEDEEEGHHALREIPGSPVPHLHLQWGRRVSATWSV